MSGITPDQELDCRGLNCPLPVLKTKKAMDSLQSGQVLRMVSTDPGSVNDIHAWCRRTGNELIEQTESGEEYQYLLKKK
ncbi:MAG: sulfurtransferase TusA family protein [Deltaproteobacteria bacterium]|nr:sulfurtransferase TusA family protein [Deltaproteobacteria bacterium]